MDTATLKLQEDLALGIWLVSLVGWGSVGSLLLGDSKETFV